LEAASEALLAMKHNLLAMSDGTETPSGEDEEEDVQRSKPWKKRRVAA
jgi:MarR family transcriptional regulator for hemolysin